MSMLKKNSYNIAIVGATGAVGMEMIATLEKRKFPVNKIKFLASEKSVGKKLTFQNELVAVETLGKDSFKGVDIALFSAGSDRSREFAPMAVKAGAVVIDNSSAFRTDPKVPLVVPEVNPQDIKKHQGIIANPNCTTIIMAVAVYPIHKTNPIKRIEIASYQAVSGAGATALEELKKQQKDLVEGRSPQAKIFKHIIANNIFSHDSRVMDNGYNQEELKMVFETHKIFGDNTIEVNPTCIRVPIYRAHSEALHLELTDPIDLEKVFAGLLNAPGLRVVDDRGNNHFPMPLEVSGQDEVFVGRIRPDLTRRNYLNLFVCGDQLLKGAALNAVQIAEYLARNTAG